MNKTLVFITIGLLSVNNLFAAEAGMPQLDPTYWISQVFWLTIIFSSIYFLVAKMFIPKIKGNLDARENKIRKDILSTAIKYQASCFSSVGNLYVPFYRQSHYRSFIDLTKNPVDVEVLEVSSLVK